MEKKIELEDAVCMTDYHDKRGEKRIWKIDVPYTTSQEDCKELIKKYRREIDYDKK